MTDQSSRRPGDGKGGPPTTATATKTGKPSKKNKFQQKSREGASEMSGLGGWAMGHINDG